MFQAIQLKEIISYLSRGIAPAYAAQGTIVLNQKCIRDHRILVEEARITDPTLKQIPGDKFIQPWDVLVNSTGVGTLGRIAQNKSASLEATVDGHVTIVRPDHTKVNGAFFGYALISVERLIASMGEGATGQTELSRQRLKEVEVPIPEMHIQQKIAAILSAYDDLIENNLRRIKLLEQVAQTLYREWFVKFRFPGHQKAKLINSPLGKIPEGWVVKHLSDVCSILMGQSPKSEFYNIDGQGLPFHQGVTDFGERFPTTRVYCTFAGRIAEAGDILFSVRAPVGRLNLTDRKIIIGRGLSAIRNLDGCQYFTFHQLKEIFTEEDIMGGGTIFKAVTKGDMERIECLYPPKNYILWFEKVGVPIAEQIAVLDRNNRILRQTRDLLLPKLISGVLDVSELDLTIPEANT